MGRDDKIKFQVNLNELIIYVFVHLFHLEKELDKISSPTPP